MALLQKMANDTSYFYEQRHEEKLNEVLYACKYETEEKQPEAKAAYFVTRYWFEGKDALTFRKYPYIWDYEWYVVPKRSDKRVGDLVLADDKGNFAIVEIKVLHPGTGHTAQVARTEARKAVKEQAEFYATAWAEKNEGYKSIVAIGLMAKLEKETPDGMGIWTVPKGDEYVLDKKFLPKKAAKLNLEEKANNNATRATLVEESAHHASSSSSGTSNKWLAFGSLAFAGLAALALSSSKSSQEEERKGK